MPVVSTGRRRVFWLCVSSGAGGSAESWASAASRASTSRKMRCRKVFSCTSMKACLEAAEWFSESTSREFAAARQRRSRPSPSEGERSTKPYFSRARR